MKIEQLEEKLFCKWAHRCPDLVRDGVAHEDTYLASEPRILLVMKEVNDPGGGGWDLREFMREGGRGTTWNNVTRWVKGIRNLERDISWSELEEITEPQRIKALRSIAVMNLKKSPGGHTTKTDILAKGAWDDRDLLTEQFLLYDADLAICCGSIVGDLFDDVVEVCEHRDWKSTSRGIWYRESRSQKYVVAYSHPQARVSPNLLYYGLVDAVREILPDILL